MINTKFWSLKRPSFFHNCLSSRGLYCSLKHQVIGEVGYKPLRPIWEQVRIKMSDATGRGSYNMRVILDLQANPCPGCVHHSLSEGFFLNRKTSFQATSLKMSAFMLKCCDIMVQASRHCSPSWSRILLQQKKRQWCIWTAGNSSGLASSQARTFWTGLGKLPLGIQTLSSL